MRPSIAPDADPLAQLLHEQEEVITRPQALGLMSAKALQHRLESGRWQVVSRGIYLAHTGQPTREQRWWSAVLAAGANGPAVLAGLSALERLGLRGHQPAAVHVLIAAARRHRDPPSGVVVHRTRRLGAADVRRASSPPCTTPARSLIDAAQWASTDDRARTIIAAGFQQRLIRPDDIDQLLRGFRPRHRLSLIREAVADARLGAESISESDFLRLCRRAGLPTPSRQVRRTDARGRRRYLDVYFDDWKVQVEIDGSQHLEVGQWWADMRRQNDLWISGLRVLRFPAWVIRDRPQEVADQVRAALTAAGWQP